jgi:ABC-type Fe3+-citrate transport system substrate-binding protein
MYKVFFISALLGLLSACSNSDNAQKEHEKDVKSRNDTSYYKPQKSEKLGSF